jgi:uncharacterized membrane protein HdeD (DUF308 family)
MSMSLEAAAQVMREAMRETVKRHSLWYLVQSGLLILAGIVALVYPALSSVAVVIFLGWLLIISGILQAIGLIGARHVPHFWLQLVSVALFLIVGVLFLRNPGESLVTLTLLLIVLFLIEGISKVIFALTIRPLPNWGWVLGQRNHRDCAGLLSLGQHAGYGGLAHRRIARDRAHLRGRCPRPSGLGGAQELTQRSLARGARVLRRARIEELVDGLNHDRSLADARGDALDRA